MKRQEVAVAAGLALLIVVGMSFAQAQTASPASTVNGGAMLYANGNAKVNGQAAGISTSVFAGDRIEVGDSSSVSISRSGSSVVLSPNSMIQYEPTNLEVLKGTVRVSTSQGLTVRVGNVSVAPMDHFATTKFDVIAGVDNVGVASQEGGLTISDNGKTVALSAGSNTTVASLPAVGQAAPQSTVAEANFLGERLSEHPFYGVVNGISTTPATLPVCASISICLRPNVSQIHPCCCPPLVKCTGPTP